MLPLLLAGGAAGAAGNCDEIRQRIEAKIRAGGVSQFTLAVVDAAASTPGRVVGTCDLGRQRIVYQAGANTASAANAAPTPVRSKDEPMLTECKDGTVKLGGDCRR